MSETQLFARHDEAAEPPLPPGFVDRSVAAGRVRRRRRRVVRAAVGGVAAVVAIAVGVTVVSTADDPSGDRRQPSAGGPGVAVRPDGRAEPRDAADLLGRISRVASQKRVDIRDDQFIHEKRYSVTRAPVVKDGELKGESERWVSVDGSKPGWMKGLDKLGRPYSQPWPAEPAPALYGNQTYKFLTTLPTDPDELLRQIYAAVHDPGKPGYTVDRDQEAFDIVGHVLNGSLLPPDLGGALYRAVAKIPGVTLATDAVDVAGRHGIGVTRVGRSRTATWIFDRETYDFMGASVLFNTKSESEGRSNYALLLREVVDSIPS